MTLRWMREMDRLDAAADAGRRPATRAALRLDAMTGDWINTNAESSGLRRVVVSTRDGGGGGGMAVRPVSAGEPAPGDWGTLAADAVFADGMRSDHGMAWIALARTASGWESRLQANVNLGLLVLAVFHASPGRERSSWFAREFYRRAGDAAGPDPGATAADAAAERTAAGAPPAGSGAGGGGTGGIGGTGGSDETGGGGVDPAPLAGTWHNTNPAARGIARINLERTNGAFTARVAGVGGAAPVDWGRAPAIPFAHDAAARAAMAFRAAYDFGFQQVELQANVKQGVLVVASFNSFAAGDPRSSYFTREFFYR